MRAVCLTLIALLSTACSTPTEPKLGDEFELHVGESAALTDVGLWVAFLGVGEDSRCPLQAMCVWAGDAAVLLETAPLPDALAADSRTDTLHTHVDPMLLQLGSLELVLVRLDPYPETPLSIGQDTYIATLMTRRVR